MKWGLIWVRLSLFQRHERAYFTKCSTANATAAAKINESLRLIAQLEIFIIVPGQKQCGLN
jgi:hypothetical protein